MIRERFTWHPSPPQSSQTLYVQPDIVQTLLKILVQPSFQVNVHEIMQQAPEMSPFDATVPPHNNMETPV